MGLGALGTATAPQAGLGRWEGLKQGPAQTVSTYCRRPPAQRRAGWRGGLLLGSSHSKTGWVGWGAAYEPVNKQSLESRAFQVVVS